VSFALQAAERARAIGPSAFQLRFIIFPSWTGGRATFEPSGETFQMRFETEMKAVYLRCITWDPNAFQLHLRFLAAIFSFHLRFTARVRFSETKRFASRNAMIR
jgi:hypothetical protein